ncbi:MAG: hypothetical protein EA416_04885 [Trueperaceae bacterium]|nr:MAG: hypothetical protein EA416_04885 [Trueperaceae bacterium]
MVVIVAYTIVRSLLRGAVPFARRTPWVVDGRVEAALLAAIVTLGLLVDLTAAWRGHSLVGLGPSPTTASLLGLAVLGALGVTMVARRGFAVVAVRDEDFREAIDAALRGAGYTYDVRVDAGERVDRVALRERWEGVELVARSRLGEGTLRAVDDAGRVVAEELVDHLRTRFRARAVGPHRWFAAGEIAAGLALAAASFLVL